MAVIIIRFPRNDSRGKIYENTYSIVARAFELQMYRTYEISLIQLQQLTE